MLVDAGADVNAANNFDSTSLHALLLNPHASQLAPVLLRAGADVNVCGVVGVPPLHQAIQLNFDLAAVLVDAGTDVNAKDDMGRTPIFFAVGVSKADAQSQC